VFGLLTVEGSLTTLRLGAVGAANRDGKGDNPSLRKKRNLTQMWRVAPRLGAVFVNPPLPVLRRGIHGIVLLLCAECPDTDLSTISQVAVMISKIPHTTTQRQIALPQQRHASTTAMFFLCD
jgi:hypothetical protein